jgi:hypothetical protein
MLFERLVQAATVALGLPLAAPGSAQQVLKIGSTSDRRALHFLDTKVNSMQGGMVDLNAERRRLPNPDAADAILYADRLVASNKIDIISAASWPPRRTRRCDRPPGPGLHLWRWPAGPEDRQGARFAVGWRPFTAPNLILSDAIVDYYQRGSIFV